ncbi:TrbI/VirB10 family protein [Blastomonas sp. UPD001]|uniref:TrbI/VirB10 family protein n=1 Tax=Blastomonas sp. UPD001 TaxID=2217673 RepID=UPI000E34E446|nr:TrbI/VirB10 family protein [Blastomonas sp. UPD001]
MTEQRDATSDQSSDIEEAAPDRPPQSGPADPRPFQLRSDPPQVMRLSPKALAVIGAGLSLGIGGALIYALAPQDERRPQELYNTDSRATSETITSGPSDYGGVPKLGPPLPGDLGGPIVSAQQRGQNVPVPPVGTTPPPPDPRVQAAEAARQRAAEERDTARMSGVFLGNGGASGAAAPALPELAGLPPQPDAAQPAERVAARDFLARESNRRVVSPERLVAPASPNILQAGSMIPAALVTGIRSDLPGQITAQVTQNVYDSPTGRILLVPQGARLIGEYDSEVAAGQTRVLLAWDRLIMPDGRSIILERQPGADGAGFAGLQDRVNQHWGNLLRAAAISTLLGIGTELGADSDDDVVRALRRGSQDTFNQSGQRVVDRQLNVPPTLTIRPGHPLRVMLTRDLILEPIGGTR